MEVKLVITPSEEMVSLVQSILTAFTANNLVDKVAEMQKFASEQKQPNFESGGLAQEADGCEGQIVAPATKPEEVVKKRRTKAEIEAEKVANRLSDDKKETIRQQEDWQKEVIEPLYEEKPTETVNLSFVPSVVKLRKMTVNRSEKIDDVPAKLMEFGYSSVTALAKDEEASKRYYLYLISVSALTDADNE